MSYIESNNLTVFPISTPRTEINPVAHVLTERNLVSLTKNLLDYPSYVITESFTTNKPFEFVLDGYYFKIDKFSPDKYADKGADKICAKIVLAEENSENNSGVTFQHIAGDSDAEFTGLVLSKDEGFVLLQKDNNNDDAWIIPDGSRRKFNSASVNVDIIDGGQD